MDTPHLVAAGAESNYTPTRVLHINLADFLHERIRACAGWGKSPFFGIFFFLPPSRGLLCKKERKEGTDKCSPSEMGQFCPFGDFMRHCHMCGTGRVSG